MRESHWIWGRRPVLEALKARRASRLLVASKAGTGGIIREILNAATVAGVPTEFVEAQEIHKKVGDVVSQGVAARVSPASSSDATIDGLLAGAAECPAWPPLLLILDQVQDPHNTGSLIRTAEICGAHGVITTIRHTASLTGTVAKASAGAVNHIPLVAVRSLVQALDTLAKANVWTVALDARATTPIYDVNLTVASAIIVGSEGSGTRRLTAERADIRAALPMRGHIASYNASVAGAIAMYEALRQRAGH